MKRQLNIIRIIEWSIVAASLLLMFYTCNRADTLAAQNAALKSSNVQYKNDFGTLTTKNRSLITTNDELRKSLSDTVAKLAKPFRKISAIVQTSTKTIIPAITVTFADPVPCAFVRSDWKIDPDFRFKYCVDNTGLQVDSLEIPNQQITIIGFQRKNFFSPMYAAVEVTNTSKYVITTALSSTVTQVPRKWYDSKALWFVAGAIGGAILLN